ENLQTRVSWDSCTSWPSFETLPTMNALSDYLTKSGREESGGLLGAYIHQKLEAPIGASFFAKISLPRCIPPHSLQVSE
ncbi:MAG: hypothetical protein MSA50_03960, partial [Veillonellaceae bacterium]|nr:hypothetical protein [Veillonellaceae bacterium]